MWLCCGQASQNIGKRTISGLIQRYVTRVRVVHGTHKYLDGRRRKDLLLCGRFGVRLLVRVLVRQLDFDLLLLATLAYKLVLCLPRFKWLRDRNKRVVDAVEVGGLRDCDAALRKYAPQ